MPRALWATEKGMDQEQALLIVAVHDAGFLLDALARVQAQRSMADFWCCMKGSWLIAIESQRRWLRPQSHHLYKREAAETPAAQRQTAWERQADKQQSKQQQQAVTKQPQQQQQHLTEGPSGEQQNKQQNKQQDTQQNKQKTKQQNDQQSRQQGNQQNNQRNRQQDNQKQQQHTRQQQRQQHHVTKAAEAQRQQQWSPRPKPTQQENKNTEYLRTFERTVGPQQWQQIIDLSVKYEDPALADVVHYWTIAGFKDQGAKQLAQDRFTKDKQQEVYKNTTSIRTLGANSPRGGDDWPD